MTKDEIIRMVHEAIAQTDGDDNIMDTPDWLVIFANLVALHEREACAEVCEDKGYYSAVVCADAIRARSQS